MKISPVKNNVAPKILVDKSIQEPYLGYLNQASGVIENYLKYSIREKQEMGRNARKNINTYKFDTVKREWIKFINNIIKN